MARRTGSLAVRAVVLFGVGMALILAVVVAGVWWVSDRIVADLVTELEANNAMAAASGGLDMARSDVALLKWVLVLGLVVAFAAALAFFWLILRRQVVTPLRQLGDVAGRVGR